MLLRLLTIATVSVAYLSSQALSSTETKSQRLTSPAMLSKAELAELPTLKDIARTAQRQASLAAFPPLPQSYKIARLKTKNKQFKLANRETTKQTRTKQKIFVRLSYMPPSFVPSQTTAIKTKRRDERHNKHHGENKVTAKQMAKTQTAPIYQKPATPASLAPLFTPQSKKAPKPKYSLGAVQKVKKLKNPKIKKAKAKRKTRKRRYRSVNYMKAALGGI